MRALAGLAALLLVACAAAEAPAQPEAPATVEHPIEVIGPVNPPPPQELSLRCAGAFTQGGIALCRTLPNAPVSLDGASIGNADAEGWIVIGFTREHGAEADFEHHFAGADGGPCGPAGRSGHHGTA